MRKAGAIMFAAALLGSGAIAAVQAAPLPHPREIKGTHVSHDHGNAGLGSSLYEPA